MLREWKSHPLVSYFVLTYAISWLTLGLVALASHGLLPFHARTSMLFSSGWSPVQSCSPPGGSSASSCRGGQSLGAARPSVSPGRSARWPVWGGTGMAWVCIGKAPESLQRPGREPHPGRPMGCVAPSILLHQGNNAIYDPLP